jgi:uncharacterized membrane protein YphA (DoxX/SURF4 family)
MTLPIPPAVLYAGLAGVLLSLIVATATNGWQCRVFVILALRLATGWFFLFAGLDKLHSFAVGPTDKNKEFTSAPYFNAAEGLLGKYMRTTYLGDPEKTYTERLTKKKPVTAAEFDKLSVAEQAALSPDAAAEYLSATLTAAIAAAEKQTDKLTAEVEKAAEKGLPSEVAQAKADLEAHAKRLAAMAAVTPEQLTPAKAAFAAWVYGADARDAKVDLVTGEIPMTADERLAGIALLQKEYDALAARAAEGLGGGYGYEMDRYKKLKADLRKAKTDLAADTDKYLNDSLKSLQVSVPPVEKPIKDLDVLSAWTITLVGAGLLLGLFTKLWCLVGVGFLTMTYLAHPTVPWLPLPPLTAGNPVFVNENIIMALGLLVVLAHPTGRWLGLDALLWRLFFGDKPVTPPPATV